MTWARRDCYLRIRDVRREDDEPWSIHLYGDAHRGESPAPRPIAAPELLAHLVTSIDHLLPLLVHVGLRLHLDPLMARPEQGFSTAPGIELSSGTSHGYFGSFVRPVVKR